MFNFRPDELWPWLSIGPSAEDVPGFRFNPPTIADSPGFHLWSPPVNDPPGFRMAADGSVRDGPPRASGLMSFGYDPNAAAPFDLGYTGAIRPAADAFHPPTYPAYDDPAYVLSPSRDRVRDALEQLAKIHTGIGRVRSALFDRQRATEAGTSINDVGFTFPGYGSDVGGTASADVGFGGAYRPASDGNSFGFLDRRGADVDAMPSFDGGSLQQHAISFLFPKMAEAQLSLPGVQGYGNELDVQPDALVPGFNVKPPTDDAQGFRIAIDGSIRDDVAFVGPSSAAGLSPPSRVGFAVEDRPLGNNPFNFLDRQDTNVGPPPYTPPPPQPSPIFPWTTKMPPLERELQGYLDNLDRSRDTPPAAGDTGLRTDDDAAAWRVLSDTFGPRSFEHNRRDEKPPLTRTRQIEGENRLLPDLYDPTYLATLPRNHLQEAFDQLSRIYAGVGLDPLNRFNSQRSGIRPTMLRGEEVSPAIGDAFDPQYVTPAQSPGAPTRPPPGRGDNNPPRSPAPLDPRPGTVAPLPRRPTTEQPAPSPAGPAAAAEAALRQREDAYKTYREHLQQLDPDHPLLKLEPVSGVVPDQATVDRYGDEVRGIVRTKIDRTIEDLSARSTYDQRSAVRTIGGDVDLRAEFERLKAGGKRIQGGGAGQYSRGDGELYELPGGLRVGFRMANDTRTGEKRSIPTLDIIYPGRRVRFHYNNRR